MWATIPLAVSIVGMVTLVALKACELRRGRTFLEAARARLDARVLRLFAALQGDVPQKGKLFAADALHHATVQITGLVLLVVRFVERRLTRFVNMVKGRRNLKNGIGTRSTYLRDVTTHRDEVRRQNGYHPKE